MSINSKKLLTSSAGFAASQAGGVGEDGPQAISFDGVSNGDKLALTSSLAGATDSKTFTISFWFWGGDDNGGRVFSVGQAGYIAAIVYHSGIIFEVKNSSNSVFVELSYTRSDKAFQESWNHVVWSMDTNSGDYQVWLNDENITSQMNENGKSNTGTPWWNSGNFAIAGAASGNFEFKGRLAHVFADYKYRDFNVVANRRLFITSDLKPVTDLTSVDSYSSNVESFSEQNIQGVEFNSDGSKFYTITSTTDAIYEYSLSTPYDISTRGPRTYKNLIRSSSNDNPTSATWSADGTKLFVFYQSSNVVATWSTSTPFSISGLSNTAATAVSTEFAGVRAGVFNSSGTKSYVVGLGSGVWEFTHSAYSFSIGNQTFHEFNLSNLTGIRFNSDGTKLFLHSVGTLYEYSLSTAYDLTSASLTTTYPLQSNYAQFAFNNDGTELLVGGTATYVFTNTLSTGYDLSTASYGVADGNPAQPIVYVPATDVQDAGRNDGFGGDLSEVSILDQAGTGPNQNNTNMSRFNGTNQRLYKSTTPGTIPNSTVTTISFIGRTYNTRNNQYIFHPVISNNGGITLVLMFEQNKLIFWSYDRVAGQTGFQGSVPARVGCSHHWAMVIDTSSQSLTKVFRDNVEQSITWSSWNNNSTLSYGVANMVNIGSNNTPSAYLDGAIGELYFDTSYIDIASNNIFWDADKGKPKPIRQVLDETGNSPLIAMPLHPTNSQLNLGTFGNFINVGDNAGHRGMSEFNARSIESTSSSSKLSLSVSHTMGQQLSLVMAFREDGYFTGDFKMFTTDCLRFNTSNHRVDAFVYDTTGSRVFSNNDPDNLQEEKWYIAFISVDLSNTNSQANEVRLHGNNRVENFSVNYDGAYNSSNNLKPITSIQAIYQQDNYTVHGGAIYFTDTFIDFQQEENRNKFLNQMGYLKDLEAEIDAGNIPTPLVYLPMDDPTNYGKNLGTLNDFTVNGSLNQGPDIDIING
jgi:hypothetical protein